MAVILSSHRALAGWLLGLACLAAATLAPFAQAQPPAKAPFPWIDVHLHLIGGRGSQQDFGGALTAAISEMDRWGVATAIVMPPPQVDSQEWYDAPAYARAIQSHRGRFAWLGGGGELNSMLHRHADPASVTDAVSKQFVAAADKLIDAGAIGFGEIAAMHLSAVPGHPYEFVPTDHPLLRALADVAARRGVPIELHMDAVEGGMATPPRFAAAPNPPTLPDTMGGLARLLAHNPKASIIWAHAGSDPLGAKTPAALGKLMDAHPNLHASLRIFGPQAPMQNKPLTTAGLDPQWKDLLARHADRFMIGTDSFIVSPSVRGGGPGVGFAERNAPKYQATIHFLSLLPPEIGARVGRENAMRLYKLAK